jgi:hypothetical protein
MSKKFYAVEIEDEGYKYKVDISGEDLVRIQLYDLDDPKPKQEISFGTDEVEAIFKAVRYVVEGFERK